MRRGQGFGNLVRGGRGKGGFEDVEPRRRMDVWEAQKIVVVACSLLHLPLLVTSVGRKKEKKEGRG